MIPSGPVVCRGTAVTLLAMLLGGAGVLPAQQVPVVERTVSNGMRLLLLERHDDPTVSGGWVAHVGSANERPGITGIAHLFEHMMFKGTPTIGTTNYPMDLAIIQKQEALRAEMRQEETKMRAQWRRGELSDLFAPENRTERLKELDREFQKLVAEQREVLVKNEFDRVYTKAGGSGMNAFTSEDMTAYFITVPANKLELWCWMESERLWRPVFREFYAERDVVYEERRLGTEATPLGKYEEAFEAMVWQSHPYGWPVIGWPSDLPLITKADADTFYALYYAPQNITLVLVGDFNPDQAVALAERYFGRIPRGKADAPEVITREVEQVAEKRMNAQAEVNPQVDMVWHTVPFGHRDAYALNILSQVLSTRTGRLYKGLVLGRQVATEVSADPNDRKWAGLFAIHGEVKEGHTPEEVEQAIDEELDKLKQAEVPAEELQKVKNNFAAYEFRTLGSNMSILFQLMVYDGLGNWREINEAGPKHQAVTAADVKRVVNGYFTKENRNVAVYTRKPAATREALAIIRGLAPASQAQPPPLPARPEQLEFPPLVYEPPRPADYRVALASGAVAYVVPDRELPLVNLVVSVRAGDYLDPAGKAGLAGATGYLLARGGTKTRTAEELEERLAFLAADLDSHVGDTKGSVSLNLLSKDLDEGLALLREVLTEPRFQEDKVALRQQQLLQEMKRRNDDSADIEQREGSFLAYGEAFWANRHPTEDSIRSLTRDDLRAFHRQWFHPANFVVALNGNLEREVAVKKLESLFADWPFKGATAPLIPGDIQFASPGVYLVDKEVNQGRVSLLLPGVLRDSPDYFGIEVMNDILGGGGFTSRMVNRVRSDEGLAYAVQSDFPGGVYFRPPFVAGFQTKSRTVPYAIGIMVQELRRMAAEVVSDDELQTTKRAFTDTFPHRFATKTQVAATFADDEFTGRYAREPDYWKKYRSRVDAVTAADVQRVAVKYLDPDRLVILIVGEKNEVLKGHPDHRETLADFGGGKFTELPLRDPMTMKP